MDRLIANQHHSEMLRLDPTSPQSPGLLGPRGPRGRADGVRRAPTRRCSPMPTTSRPSTASSASRAPARTRRSRSRRRSRRTSASGVTATASCSTASAPAAGTSPSRPAGPSNDGRVGVWHHIAYDAGDGEETQRARDEANEGLRPWTKIFDHYFFDSCYTMSPGGRMEICTTGPGFQLDEKLEDLGDRLCLSPRVEPLRAKLEAELTPIVNPRPRSKQRRRPRPSRPPTACPRRSLRASPDSR